MTADGPPSLRAAFDHVDAHSEQYLRRLMAYLDVRSVSATGEGMRDAAEHIAGVLREVGFSVDLVETEGWPVVVGSLAVDPTERTILFYGHYDVQPSGPIDEWDSPPFLATLRDGRVYARGAGDNKGQHLANVLGIASLRAVLGTLPCNVKVLLDGEEEVGSPNLRPIVAALRRELAADLVIVSDGPMRAGGEPCVTFGARGVVCFELFVEGARRDLHSGNWGGVAPNALWELVHVLASMRDRHGAVTIDGFYDDVRPPSVLERRALDALSLEPEVVKEEIGASRLEAGDGADLQHRLSYRPSLSVNGLRGGYDGPGVLPIVPHRAAAKCDVRLVADQRCDDVYAKIEAHVGAIAPQVRIERLPGSLEPSITALDSPLAEPVRRAVAAAQGSEPVLVPVAGGSGPTHVFTDTLGAPLLVVPYANADEANHAPNENLELERFFAGIRCGAAIVAYVGAS